MPRKKYCVWLGKFFHCIAVAALLLKVTVPFLGRVSWSSPVTFAVVIPYRLRIIRCHFDLLRFRMLSHLAAVSNRDAPIIPHNTDIRQWTTGPYHACFRINTGSACYITLTTTSVVCCIFPTRTARSARGCGSSPQP